MRQMSLIGGGRAGAVTPCRLATKIPTATRCCSHRCVPGTDYEQYAYKLECTKCGYVYGANGADLHLRLCPQCQSGAPGIRYWKVPDTVDPRGPKGK
jgi:hypothetical protein